MVKAETNIELNSQAHVHRDDLGARMGMWLFLFTEVLLFGGMFLVYAVYRFQYSDEFRLAAMELNTGIGALNTIILLTSSLTVAASITAIQKGNKLLSIFLLISTIIFALVFMVNKFFEWSAKISHGIYPGSPELLEKQNGEILFFGLYYVMTGLHALHVIIGVVILVFILVFVIKNKINADDHVKLENSGLYWHLVDLIWIFLFPLFYLIH